MKPHLKKQWCISKVTGEYIARMERILDLYEQDYDSLYPVLCFDERPCFLIGNTIEGLAMKKGSVAKENYAYSKHGSCCALAALEPLTGKRIVHVRKQRRKEEFALLMYEIYKKYSTAKRIQIVLDNLNTHHYGAFYEFFTAEVARAMTEKIKFIYTPKSASWLNMIEIEFSALARQCLNRRIPCQNELEKQVLSFMKQREKQQIKINWQFTTNQARKKLNTSYSNVFLANKKYTKI